MEKWGWVVYIGHSWIFEAISMLHYFTIFWVVGTIALIDLRVLGLVGKKQTAAQWQEQLSPWMWTAMTICLITGFLEFTTGAGDFYMSNWFLGKMILTLLGVILAVTVFRSVPRWDRLAATPITAKFLAALCLIIWVSTILWGVEIANNGYF
jgi:uncharacterized membrane protein SirB2